MRPESTARRRRYAIWLFVVATIGFLALAIAMAAAPAFFATPLGGGPATLGMLIVFLDIVLVIGATGLFVRTANRLADGDGQ